MKRKDLIIIGVAALGTYLLLKYTANLENPIETNDPKTIPDKIPIFKPGEKVIFPKFISL